jgi:hypothetical protein
VSPKTLLVLHRVDGSESRLRAALSGAGFSVFSGSQAIDAGPFDLVIADVPQEHPETGPALAEQLRQAYPGARMLFLSGHPLNRVLASGLLDAAEFASGRAAFLRSPLPPEVLISKVWNLLDRPVISVKTLAAY